jgi:hypothetical protein
VNGYPLTCFADVCGRETLMSVQRDDVEVELPLISQRGELKEARESGLGFSPKTCVVFMSSERWGLPNPSHAIGYLRIMQGPFLYGSRWD